jgi:hypothetical protein
MDAAKAVMARLEEMRWSKVASAAITAHLAQLGDDLRPYPRWQPDRQDRFKDWASAKHHADRASLDVQLQWLTHELCGSGYSRLGGRLAVSTDVEEATLIFAGYVSPGEVLPDLYERIMAAKALHFLLFTS